MNKLVILLSLLLVLFSRVECQNVVEHSLCEGWVLEGDTLNINMPVTVPSVVQQSLYEAGIISHPYIGVVEDDLLWISDHPWRYTLRFDADKKLLEKDVIELEFDGIDTYADVFLNGEKIIVADNMFRSWNAPVALKDADNVLEVNFMRYDSTQIALYEQAIPRFPEKYAVTRKCGYQHGWDWAPKYKNVGLWKPVRLVGWSEAKIENAYIVTQSAHEGEASLSLCMDIDNIEERDLLVQVLSGEDLLRSEDFHLNDGKQHMTFQFDVAQPKIWWPNDMGEQPLYDFEVRLIDGDKLLDSRIIRTGIKTFEMVDEPDSIGRSFYFKVNGVPMYAKGANYIPEEMIETWMNADNTLSLIREAKEAHFNMLRVWGGGIYPSDDFFDICDSLGILIWEDFMYAGSMYPYDDSFLTNAKIEAVEQVKRLASHPSLALWCGGNEISEGYYNWGWQSSLNWSEEDDKAMKAGYDSLFEVILPNAVAEFDGTHPYWPSSPSKGWGRPESLTQGDVHYWGVWWGEQPYEVYREKVGRFNSEYGYQSYPDYSTLLKIGMSETKPIKVDEIQKDALLAAHQKHARGARQIDDFINKYYPYPMGFEKYVYTSQLSQAYGMGIAIEAHRMAKPYNMGTLYWQLNDAWPVTSWSSIDYYGNKKALQYKLKELYAPVLVGLTQDKEMYAVSDLNRPLQGVVEFAVCNMKGFSKFDGTVQMDLPANGSSKVDAFFSKLLSSLDLSSWYVSLDYKEGDSLLAHRVCFFSQPKDLKLSEVNIEMNVYLNKGVATIELKSDALAKDVQLFCHTIEGSFSDNYFDLEPGKTKTVLYTSKGDIDDIKLGLRSLNPKINTRQTVFE